MLGIINMNVKHIEHLICENIKMSLQNRINELLKESPEKKAIDLARFANVSRASVSGWTTGKTTTIEGANAFSVARFFGVNAEWVQTGKGKKYPEPINGEVTHREPKKIETLIEQRPPVIEELQWKALPPKARALVEELMIKTSSGTLKDNHISALQTMVDALSKEDDD